MPGMTRCAVFFAVLMIGVLSGGPSAFSERQEPGVNEKEEFDFANGLFSRGMFDLAIDGYKSSLETYPESRYSELARYRIGESYFLQKKYAEALDRFDAFIKQHPSGDLARRAALRQGQICFFTGDYAGAESRLSSLADAEDIPDVAAAARYYMANVYLKNKDHERARDTLQRLTDDLPGSEYAPFAYMNLGDIYSGSGDFQKAADAYQAASSLSVGKDMIARAELRAGDAYQLAGDRGRARTAYRKAMDISAGPDIVEKAVLGLVSSLYSDAEYQRIIDDFDGLFAKTESAEIRSRMLVVLGNSFFQTDRFAEAAKVYGEAAGTYPETGSGIKAGLNECWALYESGELDRSLSRIDAYLAVPAGSRDEAFYLKAKALAGSGRTDEAIDIYGKLTRDFKASSFSREALYETGWLYDRSGKPEEAVRSYRGFADRYPEDKRSPGVLLKAGQNNLELGRDKEAEKDYRLFLSRYDESPLKENVLFQLGKVYINTNDFEPLIETYEKFMEEFPGSRVRDSVLYWTGRGYQGKEDWAKAIKVYSRITSDTEGAFYASGSDATAYCLYRKGAAPEAADTWYDLMTGEPGFAVDQGVYRWVADHYFNSGQGNRSLAVLRLYEERHGKSDAGGAVPYMIGENLRRSGRLDEAEDYFRRTIAREDPSPYLERSYLGVGRCCLARGQHEGALTAFEEALKLHKDNMVGAHARFEIGNVRSEMGEYAEAAKAYAMVAILYEDRDLCPRALFRAGECFKKAGMEQKSADMFEELIRKYPEDRLARKAQEQLVVDTDSDTQR